jgi:hypothetical protein
MTQGREVWTLGEAWITVWCEVAGAKDGAALLTARYVRDLSLSERLDFSRKKQPGVGYETPVVDGIQNVFKMSKKYTSKTETDAISVASYLYWIEVAFVNPAYDGVTQVNDLHTLKHCTRITKNKQGQEVDPIEEELEYDVGESI